MRQEPVDALEVEDAGFHYDSGDTHARLAASVRRYGQLEPIVVRDVSGRLVVTDGRRLLKVLKECGYDRVWVVRCDAPPLDIALAKEVGFDVNYAAVAVAVRAATDAGATPAEIATVSPFTAERVKHMATLATFDWSEFKRKPSGQSAMSFDDLEPDVEPAQEGALF